MLIFTINQLIAPLKRRKVENGNTSDSEGAQEKLEILTCSHCNEKMLSSDLKRHLFKKHSNFDSLQFDNLRKNINLVY